MARQIKHISEENTEKRLTHKLKIVCDWVDCWNLVVVAGRGMAKSQEIQAERTLRVIEDMPGGAFAFICDTYVNFKTNIKPAIKAGWRRKGYHEGIHYVDGKRPPEEWLRKCSIIVDDFEHTTFFYNGSVILNGSLDRPSLLAGRSVIHIFSDEAKYQPDKKVDSALPILRGDAPRFGHSVYFLGMTITTDMPSVTEGEYDWVFRYVKDMNVQRIKLILDAFHQLNSWRIKLYNEINGKKRTTEVEKIANQIEKWEYRVAKLRYEQTFFINASSLANIQILTVKGIKGLLKKLGLEDFKKSVFGMRPSLKKASRFYSNLSEKHFYNDGFNYSYLDNYSATDEIPDDCRVLKYLDKDLKLEGGFDVGNMKSLVIGQPDGAYYRVLKFMYTLAPHSFRELGDKFVSYFRYQKVKEIDLYYDRAANKYESMKEDDARKIKESIEKDVYGNRTGWQVNLMSRDQGNILQKDEFEFMINLMKEEIPGLPKLLIDSANCKELKSSLENTPQKITYSRGVKITSKEKKSEKLPLQRLPMESSNPSDAFKYLVMRKRWVELTKAKKKKSAFVGVGMV